MSHQWDDFSKSLAEPVPRRESLRRLGVVFAGAVLGPLGLETTFAGHRDPCNAFCRCRNKKQQNACLSACAACHNDTNRLCGGCGTYVCCAPPGPYEYGACVAGSCEYWCADGAAYCDGICTFRGSDPDNCGACGNVCPDSAPYCDQGACSVCPSGHALCGNSCQDLVFDPFNCGACGVVCAADEGCINGACLSIPPGECTPDHPYWPNC